jgi:hypothetical protein
MRFKISCGFAYIRGSMVHIGNVFWPTAMYVPDICTFVINFKLPSSYVSSSNFSKYYIIKWKHLEVS